MTEPEMEREMEPEAESETRAHSTGLIAEGIGDPAVLVLLRAVQEKLLKQDDLEAKLDELKEEINSRRKWEVHLNNLNMLNLMERRAWELMTGETWEYYTGRKWNE